MSTGGWLVMGFIMLVFWGLVIAGVVLLVRSVGHSHAGTVEPAGPSAALRILDERLARGDIDADEYGRRRQLLTSR